MAKGSNKKASGSSNSEVKAKGTDKKSSQKIRVRHILCEKQSKMLEAKAKLEAGARFDEVAREMSEDKARSGGALGTMLKSDLDPVFAEAAWQLETSTVASPIVGEATTKFGYHLIMVEGRE